MLFAGASVWVRSCWSWPVCASSAARGGRSAADRALATWAVLGARSLRAEGAAVDRLLRAGDRPGARQQLTHLVGRDTSALSADEVARAATSNRSRRTPPRRDRRAPVLGRGCWRAWPWSATERSIPSTRWWVTASPRYERFGWASARLDDVAELVLPARLTAVLVAVGRGLSTGDDCCRWRAADGAPVTRRSARQPQRRAYAEASFAGALGLRLGGRNVYARSG